MLEAGMPQWTSNEAGRNALQEAQHELMVLTDARVHRSHDYFRSGGA